MGHGLFREFQLGCGLALLTALVITLVWEVRSAREDQEEGLDDIDAEGASTTPVALFKLAVGLALLVVGSQVLVKGAIAAAQSLGVSEAVIGLTIVSAGTSMPELVTSLVAAYRGKADLAIGNVVGSNLLNQLLILGLCSLLSGQDGLLVSPELLSRDFPVMVLTTLACLPIFWSGGVINRLEGWLLLAAYGLYLTEQIMSSTAAPGIDEFRLVCPGGSPAARARVPDLDLPALAATAQGRRLRLRRSSSKRRWGPWRR